MLKLKLLRKPKLQTPFQIQIQDLFEIGCSMVQDRVPPRWDDPGRGCSILIEDQEFDANTKDFRDMLTEAYCKKHRKMPEKLALQFAIRRMNVCNFCNREALDRRMGGTIVTTKKGA